VKLTNSTCVQPPEALHGLTLSKCLNVGDMLALPGEVKLIMTCVGVLTPRVLRTILGVVVCHHYVLYESVQHLV